MHKFYVFLTMVAAVVQSHAQTASVPSSATEALAKVMASLGQAVRAIQRAQASATQDAGQYGKFEFDKLTVTEPAFVKAGANASATSIAKFQKGQVFDVVDKVGPWYAVELKEPVQGYKAGWINAANVVPIGKQITDSVAEAAEQAFKQLADRAIKMREDYRNNPYFTVSGFSIATTPPSISVNFEFKK